MNLEELKRLKGQASAACTALQAKEKQSERRSATAVKQWNAWAELGSLGQAAEMVEGLYGMAGPSKRLDEVDQFILKELSFIPGLDLSQLSPPIMQMSPDELVGLTSEAENLRERLDQISTDALALADSILARPRKG